MGQGPHKQLWEVCYVFDSELKADSCWFRRNSGILVNSCRFRQNFRIPAEYVGE